MGGTKNLLKEKWLFSFNEFLRLKGFFITAMYLFIFLNKYFRK